MLTVLTLNLNYYVDKHGPWPARKELIREALQAAHPDLIAFQAVRADPNVAGGLNQAEQVRRLLPEYPEAIFRPAVFYPEGSAEGSAILTRIPAAQTNYLEFSLRPNLEDANQRLVLHARFDLPEGPFHLFNAHFSWVEEQARDNLREALPFIQAVSGPAVLVGDLNTPAGSELWKPLQAAGWTDVWDHLHPEKTGYTFEADQPSIRIDYAWVNQDLLSKVQSIEIVSNSREARGERMSDHLGLTVHINLDTGEPAG